MRVVINYKARMATSCETTGVVLLDDKAVQQFIESNKAINTVKETKVCSRSLCIREICSNA